MSIKRLTQPSTEPVSLAEMRAQLSIPASDTTADAVLTQRIKDARAWVERRIERTIMPSNWQIKLDSFPNEFKLPFGPTSTVVSLSYVDTNGSTQTLTGSDYVLDDGREEFGWLLPAYGTAWPSTYETANAVTLVYTAGWADANSVPGPIKQAIMLIVGQQHRFQTSLESGYAPTVPQAALQQLESYRVMGF